MGGTAQYNPVTGRIELKPDGGGGWLKGFRPLDAAPANTVRAAYIMRFWLEGLDPDSYTGLVNPGHNLAAYLGFGWAEDPFVGTDYDNYTDFFGMMGGYSTEKTAIYLNSFATSATIDDFASFCWGGNASAGVYEHNLTDGQGGLIDSIPYRLSSSTYVSSSDAPWATLPVGETKGLECTYYWELIRDEATNRIRMNARINTDSLNLDTLDFDANDPNTVIPASSSFQTTNIEVMADGEYGASNPWIQTDGGDISWPTHQLVRWPFSGLGQNIVLDKMITKYYQTL